MVPPSPLAGEGPGVRGGGVSDLHSNLHRNNTLGRQSLRLLHRPLTPDPSPARGEGRNHRTPLQRGTFATKSLGGEGPAKLACQALPGFDRGAKGVKGASPSRLAPLTLLTPPPP